MTPKAWLPSVSTMPGLIELTRILRGPSSAANTPVTAGDVYRRLEALQNRMNPLMDAACDAGEKLSEEKAMFCSVE